jgi:hypothetical protein
VKVEDGHRQSRVRASVVELMAVELSEMRSPRSVYAGFTFTLLVAFYSQLNGGGSAWDKFDPILVMAFVFASYVSRRCMRTSRWSI